MINISSTAQLATNEIDTVHIYYIEFICHRTFHSTKSIHCQFALLKYFHMSNFKIGEYEDHLIKR